MSITSVLPTVLNRVALSAVALAIDMWSLFFSKPFTLTLVASFVRLIVSLTRLKSLLPEARLIVPVFTLLTST